MFLMYGSYELLWWTKLEDNKCNHEDISETLKFSLAVLHSHVQESPRDDEQYNVYHDSTWTLAYALDNATREEGVNLNGFSLKVSAVSGSGLDCDQLSDYRLSGFIPTLMKKYLLATNFTGISVSSILFAAVNNYFEIDLGHHTL